MMMIFQTLGLKGYDFFLSNMDGEVFGLESPFTTYRWMILDFDEWREVFHGWRWRIMDADD